MDFERLFKAFAIAVSVVGGIGLVLLFFKLVLTTLGPAGYFGVIVVLMVALITSQIYKTLGRK
jgi:hypothetical protein